MAMPREVTDPDGIAWTCIQAFSGLGNDPEKRDAARVAGQSDLYDIVCTPSGGARSVRVQLPGDWETNLPDDRLVDAIRGQMAAEPNG
jgi:hypothetical protein